MSEHVERGREAARRLYASFQHREPDREYQIDIPLSGRMVELADAEELVYHVPEGLPSDKGDFNYRHRFGDTGSFADGGSGDTGARPRILAPEGVDGVLIILSKPGQAKFRIEERGIVG